MPASLPDILSVIIVFQLLFLAIFLFTYPKGKRQSNTLLAIFFLAVCLNFTDGLLILKNDYENHPALAFIGNNFSLLFGPLLYLYTKSVIYNDFAIRKQMIFHALPFGMMFLFTLISYHSQSDEMKRYILHEAQSLEYPLAVYVFSAMIYLQFYLYAFASIRHITKYRKSILEQFSEVHRINLDWLSSTIVLFIVVITVGLLNSVATASGLKNLHGLSLVMMIIALFFYINRLMFKALRQPEIFKGIPSGKTGKDTALQKEFAMIVPAASLAANPPRYMGSNLTPKDKEKIKSKLLLHMNSSRPFLEPELNLENLAAQLQIKPKELSQVINECLNQNFFDFINRYRIEEAKKLLSNPTDNKITVLEVLYEVGFNSKSSFNTLFKKYTGLTPSEFKKQNMPR